MILLCGIPSEPPLAAVIERLDAAGAPFALFNQREFASCRLAWTIAGGRIAGQLEIDRRTYRLASFESVYIRLMDDQLLPELEHEPPGSPPRMASRRLHEALIGWVDLAPGRVVNRYRQMGSNGSKPYQAQLVRRHGFRIPETLVTNDPGQARAFRDRHRRVVYKSTSGVRSIVTELGDDDLDRLEAIRACPVQFQAYVPGFDVRVHTIGGESFATRIDSPGTDYRYAGHGDHGTRLAPFDLPEGLAERCLELADGLGLAFAGIDLRLTPEGEAVCFEVNPSPAYSYYEAHTGQPIAQALARYLAGAA